jgi:hypothetical protein
MKKYKISIVERVSFLHEFEIESDMPERELYNKLYNMTDNLGVSLNAEIRMKEKLGLTVLSADYDHDGGTPEFELTSMEDA